MTSRKRITIPNKSISSKSKVRQMNSQLSDTIKAFFGTLGFLFILLPIFLIGIPYKILTSPNHSYLFDIDIFRYFGIVPIVVGIIIF